MLLLDAIIGHIGVVLTSRHDALYKYGERVLQSCNYVSRGVVYKMVPTHVGTIVHVGSIVHWCVQNGLLVLSYKLTRVLPPSLRYIL